MNAANPTVGLIPAHKAQIEWNEDDVGRIVEVMVFDRDDQLAVEVGQALFENSNGACMADWLSGADPRLTPEGVYAGWLQARFIDAPTHIDALEQLGKIQGCRWANVIAAALARTLDDAGRVGRIGEEARAQDAELTKAERRAFEFGPRMRRLAVDRFGGNLDAAYATQRAARVAQHKQDVHAIRLVHRPSYIAAVVEAGRPLGLEDQEPARDKKPR